jgi:hypothetical protein
MVLEVLAPLIVTLGLSIILGFMNYLWRVRIYSAFSKEPNNQSIPIMGMSDAMLKGLGVTMVLVILPLISPPTAEFFVLFSIRILFLVRDWIYQGVLDAFDTPSVIGYLLMLSDISLRALRPGFVLYILVKLAIAMLTFLA